MLLDVCLGTRTAWKILLIMAETPGKALTRKEIKEHTKIGNKALLKFLMLLKKFDIIQEAKLGKQFLYRMNLANSFSQKIIDIIQDEKAKLNNPYFTTAVILREFVYEITNISNMDNINKIILFGSVAKHTATITSDIDVAIITETKSARTEIEITAICGRLASRFKREIQPHYFTTKEFAELRKQKNKLVEEIMKDGITVL